MPKMAGFESGAAGSGVWRLVRSVPASAVPALVDILSRLGIKTWDTSRRTIKRDKLVDPATASRSIKIK